MKYHVSVYYSSYFHLLCMSTIVKANQAWLSHDTFNRLSAYAGSEILIKSLLINKKKFSIFIRIPIDYTTSIIDRLETIITWMLLQSSTPFSRLPMDVDENLDRLYVLQSCFLHFVSELELKHKDMGYPYVRLPKHGLIPERRQ